MKMEHYISQLLYRHQCVIVPGFGAFLTELQSAEILEATHSFNPPKKVISFNAYLKSNDGLLANHVAQCEKIGYEVAVTLIENEVNSWKNKLQLSEILSLKNIGDFALNLDKNLVFTPNSQLNYLMQSFGLTSYVSPTIKREVLHVVESSVEEKEPIVLEKESKAAYPFLKYAAVFVFGLGALSSLGYFGVGYYENKIAEETLIVQTKVQQQVNQKIQEATFVISNPIPTVTLTVNNSEKERPYHIVAGSFRNEANADNIVRELIHLGYTPRKLKQNKNGLYPVFYGSYSRYSEAEEAMKQIRIHHNPDAWLLIEQL